MDKLSPTGNMGVLQQATLCGKDILPPTGRRSLWPFQACTPHRPKGLLLWRSSAGTLSCSYWDMGQALASAHPPPPAPN